MLGVQSIGIRYVKYCQRKLNKNDVRLSVRESVWDGKIKKPRILLRGLRSF